MSKKRKQLSNVHRYRRAPKTPVKVEKTNPKQTKIPKPVLQARGRQAQKNKKKNIKKAFERAKKSYQNKLVHEQALKEALGVGSIESRINTPFHKLDYETIREKGVKRKIDGKWETFGGNQGVKIQTLSLRARASGRIQADLFINNYIEGGIRAGYSPMTMLKAGGLLREIDPDRLAIMIARGELPSIAYLYGGATEEGELVEKVEAALNTVSQAYTEEIKEKAKELEPYVRMKM